MQTQILIGTVLAFLVAISVERRALRRQKRDDYRFHDALCNMLLGLGILVISTFIKAGWLGADLLLREQFHLMELSMSSPLVWVAGFFAVDHCYYWFHRAGHRINFLWAAHSVHHQSQDYNLTVALRQSWVFQAFSWFFFAPLVLVGFPPLMVLILRMVQAVYQYWLHTETIGTLGPLERFMTTPSHHRVHHGRNPQYIDKNHGGTLILWDRLYGTFAIEEEQVVFGTVSPLQSWNPLWANLAPYRKIVSIGRATIRLRDRVWIWFSPPEWLPREMGGVQGIPEVDANEAKFDVPPLGIGLRRYVVLRLAALAVMVQIFVAAFPEYGWAPRVLAALWLIAGAATLGGIVERRFWVVPTERIRLTAAVALIAYLAPGPMLALSGACLALVTGLALSGALMRAWRTEFRQAISQHSSAMR